MYSILKDSSDVLEIKKAKAVKMVDVKKYLRLGLYKQCLNERVKMRHKQVVIGS